MSYALTVQLELPFLRGPARPEAAGPRGEPAQPESGGRIEFVRFRRAKKYILRVRPDGSLRVTIPRGGSRREAEAFVARHRRWAEREKVRVAAQYAPPEWLEGQTILLHGAATPLRIARDGGESWLRLGNECEPLAGSVRNLRPAAERVLQRIAARTLVPRLHELAAEHGLTVKRALIRNQRSRWGSCSRLGVIALNFRLVQMPGAVSDYVLLHELMHLRQPNHSRRYWRLVEEVCPAFREAERWLRVEGRSLF